MEKVLLLHIDFGLAFLSKGVRVSIKLHYIMSPVCSKNRTKILLLQFCFNCQRITANKSKYMQMDDRELELGICISFVGACSL